MNAKEILTKANPDKTIWGGRIIRAEEVGKFTRSNRVSAEKWTTCACGKQDKRILGFYSQPKDGMLRKLGYQFTDDVNGNKPLLAAKTLINIENRAAEILAGLK